jgi:alkylation response protein AidB-like acyl-CoA dehydrogenase
MLSRQQAHWPRLVSEFLSQPGTGPSATSMLDPSARAQPQFALDEDQVAVRDMARAFADEVFAPNAIAWDEAKHFPVAEMRKAAELGMAGIYVAEDVGGSGLSRR